MHKVHYPPPKERISPRSPPQGAAVVVVSSAAAVVVSPASVVVVSAAAAVVVVSAAAVVVVSSAAAVVVSSHGFKSPSPVMDINQLKSKTILSNMHRSVLSQLRKARAWWWL